MCYFYIKVFSATIARRMLIVTMPFRTAVASTSHVRVTLAIMGRIRALSVSRVSYMTLSCLFLDFNYCYCLVARNH